jgi:hypothetical protein
VHRPTVYVGGAAAAEPRYRFVCRVPGGHYDDRRRQAVTAAVTRAVAAADAGRHPDPSNHVWVFTIEIPDGTGGGFGPGRPPPDIAELVLGPEMRVPAEELPAARQRERAAALIGMAGAGVPGRPGP